MALRIGVDIKAFKNGTTGIARYLRSILDVLQQTDNENHYTLFGCGPADYQTTSRNWHKALMPRWRLPGVLWQQFVLPFQLMRHRIEVLWAPEQICPCLLPAGKTRVVTTVHDLAFLKAADSLQLSTAWIMRNLFPLTIRRSTVLVTVSDFIRREALATYPRQCEGRRLVAVPNGHPAWTVPPDYDPRRRGEFLLYVGNPEPRKNLLNVVKALEHLRQKGHMPELRVIGPTGWKGNLVHDYIAHSPAKGQIRRMGYLTDEQLQEQLLTCRALVYASLYEGYGLPVVEALSLDCLVVTSSGTVMEEVAQGCAVLCNPRDPADIARAIEEVTSPGFDRGRYLQRAPEVLASRSWQDCALQMQQLIAAEGSRR